jgi:hypothetical protein
MSTLPPAPPQATPPAVAAPAVAPVTPSSPQRLALLNTLLAVLQAALIAAFGFVLTGKLDQALKERQATVIAVKTMGDLLKAINDEKVDDGERLRTVLQVAMFGSDAVYPLFVMAVSRNTFSPATAVVGLRLLALRHRGEICTLLLAAPRIPKLINELRKEAVNELTIDLACKEGA